jgi:hypothetical protein
MATKDDGGPAFPIPNDDRPGAYEAHPGMTLRDWFAGQALVGINSWSPGSKPMDPAARAEWCYEQADAMIAERNK